VTDISHIHKIVSGRDLKVFESELGNQDEMSETVGQTGDGGQTFRRKNKKRSFVQRAKKFGKSGRFGKGSEIDQDTYDYFLRILEQIPSVLSGKSEEGQSKEEIEEDRTLFVDNVFATTETQESSYCGNQLVSRVLEKLLPFASDDVIRRFMTSLADDLRRVATDPFASHILQLLLNMATFQPIFGESDLDWRRTWVLRVSKFLINNMDDFMIDPYACHLLRTAFQCLAGTRLDDSLTRSRKSREQRQNLPGNPGSVAKNERTAFLDDTLVPSRIHEERNSEEFKSALVLARTKIESQENTTDMVSSETSSGVIQSLLLVMGGGGGKDNSPTLPSTVKGLKSECKQLASHLVKTVLEGATISDTVTAPSDEAVTVKEEETEASNYNESSSDFCLLDSEACCRLLETVIVVSGKHFPKMFGKIAEKVFGDRLLDFAVHPVANYPLQKLLANCSDKDMFDGWYSSVFDSNLEEILFAGNSGVILSIAQACKRLNTKQAHFLVALMKSLHCYEPSQYQAKIAQLLVSLSTRESYSEHGESEGNPAAVNLNGTKVLQELLNFSKPIKVVSSMLACDPAYLRSLLSDPRGCYITDAFMNSSTIGEKSRDGLIKALQGQLSGMACSKHGSRSIDAMWSRSSAKGKELMAQELSHNLELLLANNFGKFVAQNLCLSTFKRSKDDWKRVLDSKVKKSELAKDFIKDIMDSSDKDSKKKDTKAMKRPKVEEEDEGFVIDKTGEYGLVAVKEESSEPKKKKKKKAKSYLDDL